jgi:hypothetical protein
LYLESSCDCKELALLWPIIKCTIVPCLFLHNHVSSDLKLNSSVKNCHAKATYVHGLFPPLLLVLLTCNPWYCQKPTVSLQVSNIIESGQKYQKVGVVGKVGVLK